jgi:UDP-N-acetylglucosamine 2-epimerase
MKQGETMEGLVILVAGACPNSMKIAPLSAELERRGIKQLLLHTGQHYAKKTASRIADIIQ